MNVKTFQELDCDYIEVDLTAEDWANIQVGRFPSAKVVVYGRFFQLSVGNLLRCKKTCENCGTSNEKCPSEHPENFPEIRLKCWRPKQ